MFALLLLTSLAGLGIGLTISSLARTSEVAIALLPLILLPMVILAGILQPVHEMNAPVRLLAQVMPSRWSFEGLLLLEIEDRPTWTPPQAPPAPLPAGIPPSAPETPDDSAQEAGTEEQAGTSAPASEPVEPEPPEEQGMAERYFPADDDRMGTRASVIVLLAMLVLLVGAMHVIFTARDVH